MGELVQLVVSGVATGAIYSLAALGFTLLWQASGTINFAQGEFVMLPAFAMLFFLNVADAPLWLAFLLALRGVDADPGLRVQGHRRRPAAQARRLGRSLGMEFYNPVDDDGRFAAEGAQFAGLTVWDANPRIVEHLPATRCPSASARW